MERDERERIAGLKVDLSQGREAVSLLGDAATSAEGLGPLFRYIGNVTDSDSAKVSTGVMGDDHVCCDCTDGCLDPTKCACLQKVSEEERQ